MGSSTSSWRSAAATTQASMWPSRCRLDELAFHPVAAPLLRLVQCPIGAGEGLHDGFTRLVLRHPDRYCQVTDRAWNGNVERADSLAQPLRVGDRPRQRGVPADLDKLLAAIAPKDIGRAQSLLHCQRESAQDSITG